MHDDRFCSSPMMRESDKMILAQLVTLTNVYVEMQTDYLEIKQAMFALIEYLKHQKKFINDSLLKKKKAKNVTQKNGKTKKKPKSRYQARWVPMVSRI